ncbi:hypothetical protein JCM6882_004912 [Rhodosporidiobolus microsporus]
MPTDLPLELQHYILKLAIPPFSYRTLAARREICRHLALVHSSWTPIAQAHLQRYFGIGGNVDRPTRLRQKALARRALEDGWEVEGLSIEDDGASHPRSCAGRSTRICTNLL